MAQGKDGQWLNELYYGDNLEVLREHVADESVDLVYLDPPFNSNRTYNVLFQERNGEEAAAQIEAFDDTWTWSHETEALYQELVNGGVPLRVADALEAMRKLLGDNDVFAYLVMMTARLAELYRVLKPTGSLYLHCDPTASHYLKLILDSIFGPEGFSNEVVWKRTSAHNRLRRFGPVHDVILFYAKGGTWTWNPQYMPYDQEYVDSFYRHVEEDTGRHYQLDNLTSNRPGNRERFRGELPPGIATGGTRSRRWSGSRTRGGSSTPGMAPLDTSATSTRCRGSSAGRVDRHQPIERSVHRAARLPDPEAADASGTHHFRQQQPRRSRARPVLRLRYNG